MLLLLAAEVSGLWHQMFRCGGQLSAQWIGSCAAELCVLRSQQETLLLKRVRSCDFDTDRDVILCVWLVHCTESIAIVTDGGRVTR